MKIRRLLAIGAVLFSVTGRLFGQPASVDQTAAPAQSLLADMKPDKSGQFSIEGITFTVIHKDENWAGANLSAFVAEKDYPKIAATSYEVQGIFKTHAGDYDFSEALTQVDANTVSFKAHLKGTPTKATNILYLSANMSIADYRMQNVFFDNVACQVPWWIHGEQMFPKTGLAGSATVSSVRVPLKSGATLVLEGSIKPYFQDVRAYQAENCDLQIAFSPNRGTITEADLEFTIKRVPSTDPQAVVYVKDAQKPPRVKPPPPKPQTFEPDQALITATLAKVTPLPAIRPKGKHFVGPDGNEVNFWGMNLVAFYPDYALADKTAENLSSRGINLVRLHHDLRPSLDWDSPDCASLLTYDFDSRTPNLKAWDRFDYLNAKLREKGIYLSMSIHGTRDYLPDDVSILHVSDQDDKDWSDAMEELNGWDWHKGFDPRKMLPVFDERCFQINVEYTKRLLTHVNPYTGIAYGKDPQLLSLELINEFGSAYTLVCGNKFPDYWKKKLDAMQQDYAKAHGEDPKKCGIEFLNSLDEAYDKRMQEVIREAGCEAPVEFSNLFRGDDSLRISEKLDGVLEDHGYYDPLITNDLNFLYTMPKKALLDKPLVVGEINMPDWSAKIVQERKAARSMLPLATAAYVSFQDMSGIIWFAWCHGARNIGPDGWGVKLDSREASVGDLVGDGVMLDQMRAAGIVFKNKYVSPSVEPKTIFADDAYVSTDYNSIISGQSSYKPGWQFEHGFNKAFGPIPPEQKDAPWFKDSPPDPIVSDTKQIVRDAKRKQMSFSAPKAEGLSGYLDGKPMGNLSVLNVPGDSGFATVIAVTLDGADLVKAHQILISRTYMDASGKETGDGGQVLLNGLIKGKWTMKITRPSATAAAPQTVETGADGSLKLPAITWNECELDSQ